MMNFLKKTVSRNLRNRIGWKTNRKIVVFESDDWGSIRMPNKSVFDQLIQNGFKIENNPYCRFDSLANSNDLEALFETLSKYRDSKDNHPIFTTNTVIANPDFEKVKNSDFTNYYYEPFIKTLNNYYSQSNVYPLWEEGIERNLFHPQFHGREHLNVPLWLNLLRKGNKDVLKAFDYKCWGLIYETNFKYEIQAPYDVEKSSDLYEAKKSIKEGLNLFEEIFGFRSKSMIAGNYIWSPALHKSMTDNDISYVQGMKYQLLPTRNSYGKRKKIRRYTGETGLEGHMFLIRNCIFEPSLYSNDQSHVELCLKDIKNSFLWGRPAIISTHRLNYIGSLVPENRIKNLKLLRRLLSKILSTWPEVEFMTSDQLGKLIKEDSKS